jgi:hypothetical protein
MKWIVVALLLVAKLVQAQDYLAELPLNPGRPNMVPADLPMRGEFVMPKELVKTVVVRGYGETPTLARYDGFKTAVEHVVGVAIVSETQVNNQRIMRDQTATYSQARVSSFHILSSEQTRQGWTTQMWVTVRGVCERNSHNCTN